MSAAPKQLGTASVAALLDVLNEIEARFPVVNWKVGDVQIWPLVRIGWFFAQWESQYCNAVAGRSTLIGRLARNADTMLKGRVACARARFEDSHGEDRGPDRRDVVFLSDGGSFVKNDGIWYERFCDPLIGALQRRRLTTQLLTPAHLYLRPRGTPSTFIQPQVDLATMRSVLAGRGAARSATLPQNREVRGMLAAMGLGEAVLAEKRIVGMGVRMLAIAEWFGRVLDRVRPRLAFIVDYYNPRGMAFVLSCRRRGIPVVDLQHGVQGELNPAYGRLPKPTQHGFDLVPDRFWVWSNAEAQAIQDWAGERGRHRAVVGGNPWLDVWLTQRAEFVLKANAAVLRLRASANSNKVALVTLQWGLSHAEQTVPLLNIMQGAGPGWTWWLRLHPVMVARGEKIPHSMLASPGRVVVDEPSTLPLYALLKHVDVHLTHSSSTVLEAASFGISSVIIGELGAELFQQQIRDGTAVLAAGDIEGQLAALNAQAARRSAPRQAQTQSEAALEFLLSEVSPRSQTAV